MVCNLFLCQWIALRLWFSSIFAMLIPTRSSQNTVYVHYIASQWRHNDRYSVSNHQPHDWLLNRIFRCRSKKTSKLRVIGLCEANSPVTGEFPAQRVSDAENVSIWWSRHGYMIFRFVICKFGQMNLSVLYWFLKSINERKSENQKISK